MELQNGWWTIPTLWSIRPLISSLSKIFLTMITNTMDVFGSLEIIQSRTIKATNSSTIPLTTSFPTRVVHIPLQVWTASTFTCLGTNTQSFLQWRVPSCTGVITIKKPLSRWRESRWIWFSEACKAPSLSILWNLACLISSYTTLTSLMSLQKKDLQLIYRMWESYIWKIAHLIKRQSSRMTKKSLTISLRISRKISSQRYISLLMKFS